jgi:hypothetical protein
MSDATMAPTAHPLGRVEIALSGLVAATVLIAARAYPWWREQFYVACPLFEIAGLPCVTCGATRAFAAAAAGEWLDALAWNPLAGVGAMALMFWLPTSVLVTSGWVRAPAVPTRLPMCLRLAVPLLLAANWVYLLMWFRG